MNSDTLKPVSNHCLVAVPERFMAPKGPRAPNGLGLTLIEGADAMRELEAQIKRGGELQIETATDKSISNLVRVGQVLAIPPCLTDQMVLCAAGPEHVRTYADITPVVEVGDTVYLDWSCLTDEREILPGIYNVPYAAIICVIEKRGLPDGFSREGEEVVHITAGGKNIVYDKGRVQMAHAFHMKLVTGLPSPYELADEMVSLRPVGGYVLLSRVWADDCTDYEIDDRMQKVRWNEAGTLIAEYNVAPLPNEGVVAWVDAPLKGALNELHPGQRVVISAGHALIETICGESYLCVRHDYVLAVKQPTEFDAFMDGFANYMATAPAEEIKDRWDKALANNIGGPTVGEVLTANQPVIPDGLAMYMPEMRHVHARVLQQRADDWYASRLPLHLANYDA